MEYKSILNNTKKIAMIQFFDQSILKVDRNYRIMNVPVSNVEIFTKFIDDYEPDFFNVDDFIDEHHEEIYENCISDVVVLNIFSLTVQANNRLEEKEIRNFFKENFFKNPTPVKSEGVYSFNTNRKVFMLSN